MRATDFDFDLPDSLIAQYPTKERSASRLLCMNKHSGTLAHHHFYDLVDLLHPNDLLLMNNSKVIPARVYGHKASGGKVEMLIERILSKNIALAHLRASKALNPGRILFLGDAKTAFKILERKENLFVVEKQTQTESLLDWLHQYGHIPLPPYMNREDQAEDAARYQTVYAKTEGSVAAPTAGLHFDEALLQKIKNKGIDIATVTLHVGSGTFQPVRVDEIKDHVMHSEWFSLKQETCDAIAACKKRGGRVIAVGTTTVRTLESAALSMTHADSKNHLQAIEQETNIFIYPGFNFQIVDAIVTNFHLPKSTLLMLVSAFSTQKNTLNAYQEAIKAGYRFFSYGDAMFIAP